MIVDALTYNARLWGQTVFVQNTPTAVYCDDHRRAVLIQDRFRELTNMQTGPDIVGLTEFWDESLLPTFVESVLFSEYHVVHGPFRKGFNDIFTIMKEKNRFLHGLISLYPNAVVKYFARTQLLAGVEELHQASRLAKVFDETVLEPIKGSLIEMMKEQKFLGSGLVLFSRFPVIEYEFVPFASEMSGLDNYAEKGVLRATLQLPRNLRLAVFLAHLHVGKTGRELEARRAQLRQLRLLIQDSPHPSLFLSDWNIMAEELVEGDRLRSTDEYRWAMDQLGLYDSYREIYPDPNAGPVSWGYTYDDTTHFSQALGIATKPGSRRHLQRLDVILRNDRLKTVSAEVLRRPMQSAAYDGRDLSDHFPIRSRFKIDG